MNWLHNTQNKHIFSCLDYPYTPCFHPYSGNPMHNYHHLQEVNHLYLFLLWFMVAVSIFFSCETTYFLVNHYGSSLVGLLYLTPQRRNVQGLNYLDST